MEWISVKDRLPDISTNVIARLKYYESESVRYYELKRVDEDDCTWRTVDDDSEVDYEWNVTHWMIPDEPEEDKHE